MVVMGFMITIVCAHVHLPTIGVHESMVATNSRRRVLKGGVGEWCWVPASLTKCA